MRHETKNIYKKVNKEKGIRHEELGTGDEAHEE